MLKNQGWHFLLLLMMLLSGVLFLERNDVIAGQFWGVKTKTWLWIAIAVPVVHQVMVGLLWRSELYHNQMTHWFGKRSFMVFKILFTVLFVSRLILLILLGVANYRTISWYPVLAYFLAGLLLFPFAYTMHSVVHYFDIDRAYGIDHFDANKYRNKPFVNQGMYKYTNNAMYKFAYLILWVFALLLLSKAALLVAAFSHLYIWVHYYCTELPDINYIYGNLAISQGKN